MKLIKTWNGNYLNADSVIVFELHHDGNVDNVTGEIVARVPQINTAGRILHRENPLEENSRIYMHDKDVYRYSISRALPVKDAERLMGCLMRYITAEKWGILDIKQLAKDCGIKEYPFFTLEED